MEPYKRAVLRPLWEPALQGMFLRYAGLAPRENKKKRPRDEEGIDEENQLLTALEFGFPHNGKKRPRDEEDSAEENQDEPALVAPGRGAGGR